MASTNKSRKPSSYDVARLAGVSQTTVSFVLNQKRDARISEETRQRVMQAASSLGYVMNSRARSLATGKTHRIGFVPIDPRFIGGEYYRIIVDQVVQRASDLGYNLLIHTTHMSDVDELYRDILSGAADGVLLIGRYDGDLLTQKLLDARFPTVCVAYQPGRPDATSVDVDLVSCGRLMARHLLNLGHRSIGVIAGRLNNSWTRGMLKGIRQEVQKESGIRAGLLEVESAATSYSGAQQILRAHLIRPDRPTALIVTEDWRATQVLSMLAELGIQVPKDVAVVTTPATEVTDNASPRLTAVYEPLGQLGSLALETLVELVEGRIPPKRQVLPVKMIVRESCGGNPAHPPTLWER